MTLNTMTLNNVKYFAAAAALAAALLPMTAQAQGINQRLNNQHQRIRQGVASGQLTRGEQRRLNRRDASIHAQERVDRRFDNGHLTGGERRQLGRELNRSSSRVYQDEHNAFVR